MSHQVVAYAITAVALVVLLSSTARIGFAILSQKGGVGIDFDVDLNDENDVYDNADDEPILPINQRKLAVSRGEGGPGGVSDVLPGLLEMSSRRRKIDEGKVPYKCGAIVFDHQIPGEGGIALNEWVKELAAASDRATLISSEEQESKELFVREVEEKIQSVGPTKWKIIYSHENGLAFADDENMLRSWRDIVERQNCHLIAAAVFSDPLDHSMKHMKQKYAECNCTMHDFKARMMAAITSNPWTGQLNHFLFNADADAPSSMEMMVKVKRAMRLLNEHFDIVLVDGKGDFAEELLRVTGLFASSQVKQAEVSDGGLVYSKDLVSGFGKMSTSNGDADFIDAVSHIYHNYLAFLMLQ